MTERETVTQNADAPPPARKCFLLEPGGQATGGKTTPSTVTSDDADAAMDARQQRERQIEPVYYLCCVQMRQKILEWKEVREIGPLKGIAMLTVFISEIRNKMILSIVYKSFRVTNAAN